MDYNKIKYKLRLFCAIFFRGINNLSECDNNQAVTTEITKIWRKNEYLVVCAI